MKRWGVIGGFILSFTLTGCGLETVASLPTEPETAQEEVLEAEAEEIPAEEVEEPLRGPQEPRGGFTADEIAAAKENLSKEVENEADEEEVEPAEEVPEESPEDSGEAPDSDDGEEPAGDQSGGSEEDGGEVLEESGDVAPVNTAQHLWGVCTITFYCPCSRCCGSWAGGPTASGAMPSAGRTVACDLPFGTRLLIEGHEYVVEDRGVSGMWVDIFVNDHQEALNRGMYSAEVYIIE